VGHTFIEPGFYLWHSPHGDQFLRDHRGATDVHHDGATPPARRASDPARCGEV